MWRIIDVEGGRRRVAVASTSAGNVVVGAAGFVLVPPSRRVARHARSARHTDAAEADVIAPMPGRILQIFVRPGNTVAAQAPLLLLEAMKMEYRLVAPRAGTVTQLCCQVGDLVDLGAQLVALK